MKAFVTGATGFLGINLIRKLHQLGWQISAIRRPDSDCEDLKDIPIEWHLGQITDPQDVDLAVSKSNADVVFHLAGDTNLWFANNERQHLVNVTGTENVIDAVLNNKVSRLIHTSSISAFGFHDEVIDEASPSTAMNSGVNYLRTKFLGEQMVKHAVAQQGLDAVILNPCAIMGPYDKHNWAQLFHLVKHNQLPGIPKSEGSYCHVEAVVDAHITAVTKGRTGHNYILAGVDHSFLEVVNKIAQLLGRPLYRKEIATSLLKLVAAVSNAWSFLTRKEPNMTPEKAKMVTSRVVAKSDKAVKELGYQNTIPLETMLVDCHRWLESQKRI